MLEEIRKKPESSRRKIALGTSLGVMLLIVSVCAYNKGYFGYSTTTVVAEKTESIQETSTPDINKSKINTPLTLALDQIIKRYGELRDSIASVMVPFITGIDVYQKSNK